MKLKTVSSVAFGIEVLADGSGRPADQNAPSLVFDLRVTDQLCVKFQVVREKELTQIKLGHEQNDQL